MSAVGPVLAVEPLSQGADPGAVPVLGRQILARLGTLFLDPGRSPLDHGASANPSALPRWADDLGVTLTDISRITGSDPNPQDGRTVRFAPTVRPQGSTAGAALVGHWFALSLTLFATEWRHGLAAAGFAWPTAPPALERTMAQGRFVLLRGRHWQHEGGSVREVESGQIVTVAELAPADQVIVRTAQAAGRCGCEVCEVLGPTAAGFARIRRVGDRPLSATALSALGRWLAWSDRPDPEVLRWWLACAPRLAAANPATLTDPYGVPQAFTAVCRRHPETFATLREGLSAPDGWTRAAALGALTAQLDAGAQSRAEHLPRLHQALGGGPPEVVAAMGALRGYDLVADDRQQTNRQIVAALHRFARGRGPRGSVDHLLRYAVEAWSRWYHDQQVPPPVVEYCQGYVRQRPYSWVTASVREFLATHGTPQD